MSDMTKLHLETKAFKKQLCNGYETDTERKKHKQLDTYIGGKGFFLSELIRKIKKEFYNNSNLK